MSNRIGWGMRCTGIDRLRNAKKVYSFQFIAWQSRMAFVIPEQMRLSQEACCKFAAIMASSTLSTRSAGAASKDPICNKNGWRRDLSSHFSVEVQGSSHMWAIEQTASWCVLAPRCQGHPLPEFLMCSLIHSRVSKLGWLSTFTCPGLKLYS